MRNTFWYCNPLIWIVVFVVITTSFSGAQSLNIIRNGAFDSIRACPILYSLSAPVDQMINFNEPDSKCIYWSNPGYNSLNSIRTSTPDFFHYCANDDHPIVGLRNNFANYRGNGNKSSENTYQNLDYSYGIDDYYNTLAPYSSNTGNEDRGYVGMFVQSKTGTFLVDPEIHYAEYIQQKIDITYNDGKLKPLTKYKFKLQISLPTSFPEPDAGHPANTLTFWTLMKFGALFTETAINYDTYPDFYYSAVGYPQVESYKLLNRVGWQEISGEFIAEGKEKYITIGNFQNINQLTEDITAVTYPNDTFFYLDANQGTNHPAFNEMATTYYLIDAVELKEIGPVSPCGTCNDIKLISDPLPENEMTSDPNDPNYGKCCFRLILKNNTPYGNSECAFYGAKYIKLPPGVSPNNDICLRSLGNGIYMLRNDGEITKEGTTIIGSICIDNSVFEKVINISFSDHVNLETGALNGAICYKSVTLRCGHCDCQRDYKFELIADQLRGINGECCFTPTLFSLNPKCHRYGLRLDYPLGVIPDIGLYEKGNLNQVNIPIGTYGYKFPKICIAPFLGPIPPLTVKVWSDVLIVGDGQDEWSQNINPSCSFIAPITCTSCCELISVTNSLISTETNNSITQCCYNVHISLLDPECFAYKKIRIKAMFSPTNVILYESNGIINFASFDIPICVFAFSSGNVNIPYEIEFLNQNDEVICSKPLSFPCQGGWGKKSFGNPKRNLSGLPQMAISCQPNPTTDESIISYSIDSDTPVPVSVVLVNVLGQDVATLYRGDASNEEQYFTLNSSLFTSGIYHLSLRGLGSSEDIPIVIIH
ncbi:MAG: hypothetical protein HYZ54_05970 [Ignavibacteriae bacterium]|nr:hypothetical protein [Ignavibacteriota bacterium]